MYSPKIREDLIPRIYREAKRQGLRMTQWVNGVIERALPEKEDGPETNEKNSRKEKSSHERNRTSEAKRESHE
jgi:hypothetical protein